MRDDLTVEDLMTTAVLTFGEHQTVRDADTQMRTADVRHLPVVDARQRIVGIVSDRDVLRALGDAPTAKAAVSKIMSRDVLTVRAETWASEAVDLMLEHKIDSVPVVDDDGKLIGIVTATDFLRVASRALGGEAGR